MLEDIKKRQNSYYQYLKSSKWQEIVKIYKKDRCEICGTDEYLALHHLNYKNIFNEQKEDFATLCQYCHLASHIKLNNLSKLRKPSTSICKLIYNIRNNNKLKLTRFALFLRRRFIAKYGIVNMPKMDYFRNFWKVNIKNKIYPFNYSITKL